ncbi:MAG: hypothetical protein HPY70_10140 [Firmicutes bacterium]|nr:hypothetical protein [Bacillota bacterium]
MKKIDCGMDTMQSFPHCSGDKRLAVPGREENFPELLKQTGDTPQLSADLSLLKLPDEAIIYPPARGEKWSRAGKARRSILCLAPKEVGIK